EFTENDIVTFEVGQKEQPESPLAFFFAETIGSRADATEERVKHCAAGEQAKQDLGDVMRWVLFFLHHQEKESSKQNDCERGDGADPKGAAATGGDAEFAGNNGKKSHGNKLQTPNPKLQIPGYDSGEAAKPP